MMTGIPRRTFVRIIATALHGAVGLILAVPALRFLLDPLRRRTASAEFVRIAPVSLLSVDKPVRVVVSAERTDAYVHFPPGPIGSVWLVRDGGSDDIPTVRCLQTICPHLGCGTDYAADRHAFSCPCHASDFDLTGRRSEGPSPRDLDQLPCRVSEPDAQGRRWIEVKYQEFRIGVATKQAVA